MAVARAALREPNLPTARLDGVERELRLLVDHREDLVGERTRIISRLRWHLHELDPGWTAPTKLQRQSALDKVQAHLSRRDDDTMVRRLALRLVVHLRLLTDEIDELTAEITVRVTRIAPSLLAIVGCGALSAAKIIGETAHAGRFRSKDAFARHNGTAPLPVWSSNRQRHRLSRIGNRQLNAALHRIALPQARCYPAARDCSSGAPTVATAAWKPFASSNAGAPTSSTEPCSPTKPTRQLLPLDRGARYKRPGRYIAIRHADREPPYG
jgi:transposase